MHKLRCPVCAYPMADTHPHVTKNSGDEEITATAFGCTHPNGAHYSAKNEHGDLAYLHDLSLAKAEAKKTSADAAQAESDKAQAEAAKAEQAAARKKPTPPSPAPVAAPAA